jgi:hypothetical protein
VSVAAITPYGSSKVRDTSFTIMRKLYQVPETAQSPAKQAYHVTLTSEARAKAMKLEGYTIQFISAKLGLDTKTIYQYLGLEISANNDIFKTTYTPPKSTYVPPKESYSEPTTLTRDRTLLSSILSQLSTVQYSASQLINSATN